MDITSIKEAKKQLEMELTQIISDRLKKFESDTGFTTESVDVRMASEHLMQDAQPRYRVSGVHLRIGI